jgi:hypothetical protein
MQLRANLEAKLADGLAVIVRTLTRYRAGQLDVVYTEVIAFTNCVSMWFDRMLWLMLYTYSALAILILVSVSKKAFAN